MGLSAPKSRIKLSNDPNNTTWSTDTSAYGHRLLTSQGWSPGTTLGAVNAPQASHYTAANSSHIRVLLREDNAGLGAKRGGESKETFGLKGLEGIFGRLNGREEAKVDEMVEGKKRDAMLRVRYGGVMGFVSGGFLVGDRLVVHERETEGGEKRKRDDEAEGASKSAKRSETSKGDDNAKISATGKAITDADVIRAARKARRAAGGMDVVVEVQGEAITAPETDAQLAKAAKRAKRRSKGIKADSETVRPTTVPVADEDEARAAKEAKRLSKHDAKAEKAARKEARRLRREARAIPQTATGPSTYRKLEPAIVTVPIETEAQPIAPTAPPQSQSLFGGSRHAVRQRYIAQKRLASMDGRAMQEILMLKAGA
ncbi:telomerase inhibitor [Oleoguttula sp. CCFEE 5521]